MRERGEEKHKITEQALPHKKLIMRNIPLKKTKKAEYFV